MDWRLRIAVVVLVLGVGLAMALQFRKHGGGAPDASPPSTSDTAAAKGSVDQAPAAAQNTVPFRSTSLDHLGESTANAGALASDSNSAPATSAATDTSAGGQDDSKSSLIDLNAPQPKHKVVDGDTLPQLAQQYLGRADRYMEIFDYNRDVLQSPDLLPIGAELRMPSRLALPAVENANGAAASTANVPPPAPLVPLIAPTARPATAARKPRTYTVQKGDNLVDIARKMYGDGRKHQDLYEANRGVMHYPGDLKPGMVLVIP